MTFLLQVAKAVPATGPIGRRHEPRCVEIAELVQKSHRAEADRGALAHIPASTIFARRARDLAEPIAGQPLGASALNSRIDESLWCGRHALEGANHASGRGRIRQERRRLCIVAPSHWESLMGGAEYQLRLLVERLEELDLFEIHYLTRRPPPPREGRGYSVHALGHGRPPGGAFFLDAPRLWRLLDAVRPHVIYQRVACAYTGVAARYARARHCHMVWHVSSDRDVDPTLRRGSWRAPLEHLRTRVERGCVNYGARAATAVVVQTQHQQALLMRNFGRAATAHIANFHPLAQETLAKPADRIRVCWIANMKPLKRPEIFVALARQLAHLPQVEFLMVGDSYAMPEARKRFEQELRELPNLRHLGRLPNEAVNELLASAHVLVNTSDFEGFSNTFIQAWLRKAVVVSLRVDPDGVFRGERYGLCAGGDYGVLASQVARLAADAVLREQIAARARLFAERSFSRENIDRLVQVLEPAWCA